MKSRARIKHFMGILLMVFTGCSKEIQEIRFHVSANGFHLEHDGFPQEGDWPEFRQRLSGGIVIFSDGNESFNFNTRRTSVEEFQFSLPPGRYEMSFMIPQASLYGQRGGSFTAEPVSVDITTLTDTIEVNVEASCSLVLIDDPENHLDHGAFLVEWQAGDEGFYRAYPLWTDTVTGYHFVYFTPDTIPSNPSAYLWFHQRELFNAGSGLSTAGFQIGYQYYMRIIE